MASCILFLMAGSIVYGLIALPIHLICRAICRHDPNQFRLLVAWLETRGRSTQRRALGRVVADALASRAPLQHS